MANKWNIRKQAIEEEYFEGKDKELVDKLRASQVLEKKHELLEICRMRCPKCAEPLKERSFKKIQIDQCTGCGGIWLDVGELEEIAGREEDSWLGMWWQKHTARSNN